MPCNRLSIGALALTFAVSLGGLVLAYGATASTMSRAAKDRQALAHTVLTLGPASAIPATTAGRSS